MEDQSTQPCRPLVEVLQGVADPRSSMGKRYSVSSVLSLCIAGMLCGCKSYGAVAQWGRECDGGLARRLGFLVVTTSGVERRPGASTLFYILQKLDWVEVERRLGGWMEEVMASLPPEEGFLEAIAVDGKTLRGTAKQTRAKVGDEAAPRFEAASPTEDGPDSSLKTDLENSNLPGSHLLSAFGHRLGVTLAQRAVSDKTNEISAVPELLDGLFLQGRVVTMDALLTQRAIAEKIVEKKGTT